MHPWLRDVDCQVSQRDIKSTFSIFHKWSAITLFKMVTTIDLYCFPMMQKNWTVQGSKLISHINHERYTPQSHTYNASQQVNYIKQELHTSPYKKKKKKSITQKNVFTKHRYTKISNTKCTTFSYFNICQKSYLTK